MGLKKRCSDLGEEIKTTLKHELGWVKVTSFNLESESFGEGDSKAITITDWTEPLTFSPQFAEATLAIIPPIESAELNSGVTTMIPIATEQPLLITHLDCADFESIKSMPVLHLETQPTFAEYFWSAAIYTEDISVGLTADISSVPQLVKSRTYYAQRQILKIPIKRLPLSFERFSKEELYLFWTKLMIRHHVTLQEAELWAIFSRVPLNLLAKVWIEADRTLRMFLHQQTIKPKIVYLVTGRYKKNQKLIQTAVAPAELAKLH